MRIEQPIPGTLPALAAPPLQADAVNAATQIAVDELLREGESDNTRTSYRTALRYWGAWYALRYQTPLTPPVPVPAVLQFVIDHVQRTTDTGVRHELPASLDQALVAYGYKGKLGAVSLATVLHRVAVLSKLHSAQGHPNPCRDPAVRELLANARRAYAKRGAVAVRAAALTREPLEQLLATCDTSLRGLRDRALLLFAWASGGRRRSEVTSATVENTRCVEPGLWVFALPHSKANQSGEERPENDKPITGTAAAALEAWLRASGIREGPLFRRIRKGTTVAEPLTPAAVRAIVRQRCALAGLVGNFTAHSLRSGFVTEAGRQNVPIGDTMAMTGHASITTVMRYFRAGQTETSRAARLFDDKA